MSPNWATYKKKSLFMQLPDIPILAFGNLTIDVISRCYRYENSFLIRCKALCLLLLGIRKYRSCALQKLLFPLAYLIRMHLINSCNLIDGLQAFDAFNGNFRLNLCRNLFPHFLIRFMSTKITPFPP